MNRNLPFIILLLLPVALVSGQQETTTLSFKVTVEEDLKSSFKPDGRLFVYILNSDKYEPRFTSVYSGDGFVFGKNIDGWNKDIPRLINGSETWTKTASWALDAVPVGNYYVQLVWDQNGSLESQVNSPGNLYSEKVKLNPVPEQEMAISLSKIIPPRKLIDNDLVQLFGFQSDTLSAWWSKPVHINASVLLPSGYPENPDKRYPICYSIAGYGGRYTRVNGLMESDDFARWWRSEEAPQVITVFLDGEGPYGDNYHINSENSGPYGEMLVRELIPKVEQKFRAIGTSDFRFVEGCSTGGWVSLALQLFYPDVFNGCWSYSPDPVSFKNMQLVNLYEDANAFYNERGYLRPSMRDVHGEPQFSVKEEIYHENVDGMSNTYITSGGQWGAWNALFSLKGDDGFPKPIFDPITGEIDKQVAEHWKKYDLLLYVKENWPTLGSKLSGKVHIWMGDMDNFYLNNAMREFQQFMESTRDPTSDAEILFSPMKQHCEDYSHQHVLEEVGKKVEEISKRKLGE